jgi:hypothetical protein
MLMPARRGPVETSSSPAGQASIPEIFGGM